MKMVLHRIRMSLVWSASFTTLLRDDPPPSIAPLAALGKLASYTEIFESLQGNPETQITPTSSSGGPALVLPWRPDGINFFWWRYLNTNPIKAVKGNFAFARLVPLRRHSSPISTFSVAMGEAYIEPSDTLDSVQMRTEAWFHPHMVSFAIHFTICGAMSLKTAAHVCLGLRQDPLFSGTNNNLLLNIDKLATEELLKLYFESVGEVNATAAPLPMVNPFSIVTVLQGDGFDPDALIISDGPEHVFLETVTQWRERRRDQLLTGRISSCENITPQGNVTAPLLFGRERNRAVWDPERFRPKLVCKSSLNCYHCNLIASTLQTEALLEFACLAEVQAVAGFRPQTIRYCEDHVLQRLIALYNGKPNNGTYCSYNLKRVIDASSCRSAVDTLAIRCGSPLHLPPPP